MLCHPLSTRALCETLASTGASAAPAAAVAAAADATGLAARLDEAACRLWRSAPSEREANRQLATALRASLRTVVRRSSLTQTVKGIATAGVSTSIAYAVQKIRKRRGQDQSKT